MEKSKIQCVDCGIEVVRSGKRGRPRVRCEAHFIANLMAVKGRKNTEKPVDLVAAAANDAEYSSVAAY